MKFLWLLLIQILFFSCSNIDNPNFENKDYYFQIANNTPDRAFTEVYAGASGQTYYFSNIAPGHRTMVFNLYLESWLMPNFSYEYTGIFISIDNSNTISRAAYEIPQNDKVTIFIIDSITNFSYRVIQE